jgi:hypothetical protein
MSDWQVGDLAVCVDDRPDHLGENHLELGRIYRVTGVCPVGLSVFGMGTGLLLEGVAFPAWATGGAAARRFRKVRPDEHESCEPEFVTLLERSRKTVRA